MSVLDLNHLSDHWCIFLKLAKTNSNISLKKKNELKSVKLEEKLLRYIWKKHLRKNTPKNTSSSSLKEETKMAASPLFDKDSKGSCEIKGLLRKIQHVCIYAANIVLKEFS